MIWPCHRRAGRWRGRRAVEVAGAFHGAPYGIRARSANFVTTYMACIRVSCRRIGCPFRWHHEFACALRAVSASVDVSRQRDHVNIAGAAAINRAK